jgi:two-component system sensor kinase
MGTVSASSFEAAVRPPARPSASPENQWGAFVSFGAALSIMVGLTSLAGWILAVPVLKSGWPGLVQIKANSAICLILLGVALWLLKKENTQSPSWIFTGQLLAGTAATIGLASFGEYLFGWDLGIDQLLFADSPQQAARSVGPGLIAPVNALSFLLLGLALILIGWTTLHELWPSQLLSFAAGLISLYNLVDFILVPGGLHTYTSLPAAVALAVLSLAVMCARPRLGYGAARPGSGPRDSVFRRWFFQGFSAERSQPLRYGGAVSLVAAGAILREALEGSLGSSGPTYVVFYPVTILAAVLGGLGPGIAATLLSTAAVAYFFLDRSGIGMWKTADVVSLMVFSVTGVGISGLSETLERTRKRGSEELRKVSLYTRGLIEAGLDPMMITSLEGQITDVNQAAEEATGVARSELIGTDFVDYFTEPEQAREGYRQVLDRGQVADYSLAIRHASGKVMEVLCHASVYRDESGAIVGVCGVARDVTERKRVEQELVVYRQHLEDLVAERTAEILETSKRLEDANKSLANVNRELETFAYSVSHDLRTPLRAVDGFSRILLEEYAPKLDTEGQRIVGVVREGTKKMAQMIDDILAFSRAGKKEVASAAIDMEELVRAALKDLQPLLAGRYVKLEIKPLPASHGDAPMIQRVWTNLLDNAIKFTRHQPEGTIEVGAQVGKGEIVYYVKDNGVGFDMQYVGKLFGVFQRLHGQNEFPGTGIGLAIVKRIVARHGGHVWAGGKVNQGATIYFALPNGSQP